VSNDDIDKADEVPAAAMQDEQNLDKAYGMPAMS
jgi:hypothetical protein